ncbi:MAG TPA: glycine betaine ABC transporter substrate-binding protein [Candidatus Dormibacteraeota bacterium]|jgi:osmoprotectant transport system substrate-binding protein|nr:glycine betaine ABC transporter substrate-binding protein [Candidatus Dormibacteraeota bacterium]
MMMPRICGLTLVLLWSAILAGCGGTSSSTSSTGGSSACPTSGSSSSKGSGTIKVGGKGFAEEQLLAQMTKLVLEKHGFTVDASFTAKDPILGQALESGTIDAYWQYTGTELQGPLAVTNPPGDLDQAYQLAKTKDEARGICWNDEGKFNDTNGLAIKSSDKSKYGGTLSAFSSYLASHPNTVLCVASEFLTRADGLPGLDKAYGHFNVPGVKASSQSTYEAAIASGQCEAGEVFTTDSAIAAKNLYVLQDDKKFFPPDNVGLLVRSSVQKSHPEIGAIMQPVIDKLDNTTITDLNKQVEIDRNDAPGAAAIVAKDFLTKDGFL